MKNLNPLWLLLEEQLGIKFDRDPKLQKSIRALSDAFTEGRGHLPADYLRDDSRRQAYLAYFVPLNFNKIVSLLEVHSFALGRVWCDFGCGPGTASLAALFRHWQQRSLAAKRSSLGEDPICIHLVDNSVSSLKLAERLVRAFAKTLQIPVDVRCHERGLPADVNFDFSMATNVVNELDSSAPLLKLWERTSGTLFIMEPSHRVSSQQLIRLRSRLLQDKEGAPDADVRILGPCLHAEHCPLYRTKHWCHFSEPLIDPRMIAMNEFVFKDPRSWLKFSYLIVARAPTAKWDQRTYRAIGDLHQSGPDHLAIDLCQPEEKHVLRISRRSPPAIRRPLVRGAKVMLKGPDKLARALPLTLNWKARFQDR